MNSPVTGWSPKLDLPQDILTQLQNIVAEEMPGNPQKCRARIKRVIASAYPDHDIEVKRADKPAREAYGVMSFVLFVDGDADQGMIFRRPWEEDASRKLGTGGTLGRPQ